MPSKGDWGVDNRIASYRVQNSTPGKTYVEVRFVSSAANIYLVMAGVIAAGIDGIDNQMELPPEAPPTDMEYLAKLVANMRTEEGENKEVDGKKSEVPNGICPGPEVKDPEPEDPNAPSLAKSLEHALEVLQADDVITSALGKPFLQWFIHVKTKLEVEKFRGHDLQGNIEEEFVKERKAYNEYL